VYIGSNGTNAMNPNTENEQRDRWHQAIHKKMLGVDILIGLYDVIPFQ
jgi:hypothetical protein